MLKVIDNNEHTSIFDTEFEQSVACLKNVAFYSLVYSLAICNNVLYCLTFGQCFQCILQRSFIFVVIFIIDQEFSKNCFRKVGYRYQIFLQPDLLHGVNLSRIC